MSVDQAVAVDIEAFAERVLRKRMWPHQLEVLTSPARYRAICAGRQVGKSVLLACAALFEAATRRNVVVLLVSAGEVASRRLLGECAALATGSPLLGGVLDESRSELRLSNGSRILSVPASERQIRGWAVDLLICDEAGFISNDVWRAAEPSIIAKPGSRVIMASSPWGSVDDFFRATWQRGMDAPDDEVQSWHWPSSVSPLVDRKLLAEIQKRETPDYFTREYLAEWTDASGAFFTEDEISAAVAPYEMVAPERVDEVGRGDRWWRPAAAGVDWGVARDANVLALVSLLDPSWAQDGRWRLFIPWLEARHGWAWSAFIDRICDVCTAYYVRVLASETNGVGAYPSDDLKTRLWKVRGLDTHVSKIWTDVRRKQSGFGMVKTLLQDGRLILPNEPELLRQLRALEFQQLTGGSMRIAVPERSGHDDIAMALMQAVSCVAPAMLYDVEPPFGRIERDPDTVVYTRSGIQVPRVPLPVPDQTAYLTVPSGRERGEGW